MAASCKSENITTREKINGSKWDNRMVMRVVLMAMLYYPLSIGLTFYQKWFIQNYHLPLTVVAGHYLLKFLMALMVRRLLEWNNNGQRRVRLSLNEQLHWLAPIGVCASLDIGLSNWALEYVTVSLYTMAKSSSILFIVGFALFLRLERWRTSLGLVASLIATGLFLFTWHSEQLDVRGLLLIELAAACTGVRWTVSQLVMQRERESEHSSLHHPLDMVVHIQPWMFFAILPLLALFEGSCLSYKSLFYYMGEYAPSQICGFIALGGVLAFCMEISEYYLLVYTSGVTLNILGINKEVMTLLLAHLLNGDRLSRINLLGLLLCLTGMLIHARSRSTQQKIRQASTSTIVIAAADLRETTADTRRLLSDYN